MPMRYSLIAVLIFCVAGWAQDKPPQATARYGVAAELELYPQTSPKAAMVSITKALQRNRLDYVIAQVTDPAFVDEKVAQFYGVKFGKTPAEDRDNPNYAARLKEAFGDFVKEANKHMADEEKQTGYLMKLLKEGAIEEAGTAAKVTHKDVPDLVLSFRQIEGRWYLLNDNSAGKPRG